MTHSFLSRCSTTVTAAMAFLLLLPWGGTNVPFFLLLGGTDVGINVDGGPNFRSVVESDAVGIAIVPLGQDGSVGKLAHVGHDFVSHLETKFVRHQTGIEAHLEEFRI